MEYTPGQCVTYRCDGESREGVIIGTDRYSDGDEYAGYYVIMDRSNLDQFVEIHHTDIAPSFADRVQHIEEAIDNFEGLAVLSLRADDFADERAALFAILDAEIPE